jgi:hypothetical protein
MTTLAAIEAKQRKFIEGREKLRALLKEYRAKPVGKTVGLKIPEPVRKRLMAQAEIWEAASYRQLIQTCIVLGLEQVEELGKIQKKAMEAPPISDAPPPWAGKPKKTRIEEFTNGLRESAMAEVPEVPRSDDSGDSGVRGPAGDEEELPR